MYLALIALDPILKIVMIFVLKMTDSEENSNR